MDNIKNFINECVKDAIMENMREEYLINIISEDVIRQLYEEKKSSKGRNKSANTKERQDRKVYNDPMTNDAELARQSLPKNWKDSTKRSYLSKLFGHKNKNPRKPTQKIIDKVHNAASA